MDACEASQAPGEDAAVLELMDKLDPKEYCTIPQLTPAWFTLRGQMIATGSTTADMLALSCVPARPRGDIPNLLSMPAYRKGTLGRDPSPAGNSC